MKRRLLEGLAWINNAVIVLFFVYGCVWRIWIKFVPRLIWPDFVAVACIMFTILGSLVLRKSGRKPHPAERIIMGAVTGGLLVFGALAAVFRR